MKLKGPFEIKFERSGGFAGISRSVGLSSQSLSSQEEEELRQLVANSGFLEFKGKSSPIELPDQFRYKIEIEYEGQKKVVEFGETTIPDSYQPLVRYLVQKTRSRNIDK